LQIVGERRLARKRALWLRLKCEVSGQAPAGVSPLER
jgi:hypothetical protein